MQKVNNNTNKVVKQNTQYIMIVHNCFVLMVTFVPRLPETDWRKELQTSYEESERHEQGAGDAEPNNNGGRLARQDGGGRDRQDRGGSHATGEGECCG